MTTSNGGRAFENDVRQTAAALWDIPIDQVGAREIGGQEIDCVCVEEDLTHLVMCTVSPALEKAKRDIRKLEHARHHLASRGTTAKAWLVTQSSPTRDQRDAARSDNVTILTLQDLQSRLIDSNLYFSLRLKYPFGSSTDPDTGSRVVSQDEYTEQPIAELGARRNHTPDTLAEALITGRNIILLGHFGAGKSITVSQVFRRLANRYRNQQSQFIPMALNLRDHWGQTRVSEAIRRHAEDIGLPKPDQLVRAWNAGRVIALLDGFDELTFQGSSLDIHATRENRKKSTQLVHEFAKQARGRVGLIVTGRLQYFDSTNEMYTALGVIDPIEIELSDFTEKQALEYLKRKKLNVPLPQWLPRRPLLISYLISHNLIQELLTVDGEEGPAAAWQEFLPRIAQREADASPPIDSETVLQLLEHLATISRASSNSAGSMMPQQLIDSYKFVTRLEPSDEARVLLGRLPGLTSRGDQSGARSFVDVDMLDVLRGRWVAQFIADPNNTKFPIERCLHPLGDLGYQACALTAIDRKIAIPMHRVAARRAVENQHPTLAADCVLSGSKRSSSAAFDAENLQIDQGEISVLDFVDFPVSNCWFNACTIRLLRLSDEPIDSVMIKDCLIERIDGVVNVSSLPAWIQSSEIGEVDEAQTTSALMALSAPVPVKVMLTILHKLFEQRGAGRKESALVRGLPQNAKPFVSKVLPILQKHGLVKRMVFGSREVVWHPERSQTARVGRILELPKEDRDPAHTEVQALR